jgi:transcriptional regulator with XRE-family HTH domain
LTNSPSEKAVKAATLSVPLAGFGGTCCRQTDRKESIVASPKKPERHFQITNNNAIDMHVGKRLRLRRTLLGMSQEQLGTELNITFQQVQKYERAANRISASRLWDMSQILDVPISYFFDDMSETTMQSSPRRVAGGKDGDGNMEGRTGAAAILDPLARRETLELVRSYYNIESATARKRVAEMVKTIATTLTEG